jgi:hypothetical protein
MRSHSAASCGKTIKCPQKTLKNRRREIVDRWNVAEAFTFDEAFDGLAFKDWIVKCRAAASNAAHNGIVDFKTGTILAWKAHKGQRLGLVLMYAMFWNLEQIRCAMASTTACSMRAA